MPNAKISSISPKGYIVAFLQHLQESTNLAQATIAQAQQRQQEAINASRRLAKRFQVRDSIQLDIKNILTNYSYYKLNTLKAKYRVVNILYLLNMRLDILYSLYLIFYINQVEYAINNPLPSQVLIDAQLDPLLQLDKGNPSSNKYSIKEILVARNAYRQGKRYNMLIK